MTEVRIDALLPPEMATRAEYLGVRKAESPALPLFALAVLAGAFIAMGGVFSTVVSAGSFTITSLADHAAAFSVAMPYGVTRLLAGLVFSLAGAGRGRRGGTVHRQFAYRDGLGEPQGHGPSHDENWGIVYAGNFVGALGTAVLVSSLASTFFGQGAAGVTALNIAVAKVSLGFWQAIALGILCNALVCMAVWLTYSARSTMDKIAAIILPIAAFVAAGFEHSIANMYFVPARSLRHSILNSLPQRAPGSQILTA
jgi:formate/nitrite transporter FocA (FNT family)